MRQISPAILGFYLVLMAGCDPGMTIRQSFPKAAIGVNPDVTVRVGTSHQLIGEILYAPQVDITNLSGSPITVTGVELAAQHTMFQNQAGSYPLDLPQGATEALNIRFRLSEGVKKTFHKSAELRVHDRVGTQQKNRVREHHGPASEHCDHRPRTLIH